MHISNIPTPHSHISSIPGLNVLFRKFSMTFPIEYQGLAKNPERLRDI